LSSDLFLSILENKNFKIIFDIISKNGYYNLVMHVILFVKEVKVLNVNVKHDVIEMIKSLPDEVDYDDIMAEIYLKQKVDKSLKQIDEGKVISHEEVKQRISKWVK
jgi:hypothetical protein